MLPRWHILTGALFALVIWIFTPSISLIYLFLIFFGAVFIDFDHFVTAVMKTKNLSLKKAFKHFEDLREKELKKRARGVREKEHFFLFHTVEFHILVAIFGLIWAGFFYIFIGMVFHSLLDLISLLHGGWFYRREFFFFNWLRKRA